MSKMVKTAFGLIFIMSGSNVASGEKTTLHKFWYQSNHLCGIQRLMYAKNAYNISSTN